MLERDPSPTLADRDADPSDDAPPRDELTLALSKLSLPLVFSHGRAAQRALAPYGFRPVQALMLGTIAGAIRSPRELAEMLEVPPPKVSALLRDLEERGLVERRADPADRRRVLLETTEEGRATIERLGPAWHAEIAAQTEALSDADLAALLRILRHVAEAP